MSELFLREEEPREISEVNVVPLADVSLVLLIILLVLSPMMTQSMLQIQAAGAKPAPEDGAPAPAPEPVLVVTLTPDAVMAGGMTFPGFGEFMSYLQTELPRRSDRKVFVAPHPEVPHGRVVHMLETLQYLGATSVALVQTAEPEGPR